MNKLDFVNFGESWEYKIQLFFYVNCWEYLKSKIFSLYLQ